jgi:phage terminase large subunit-like protein
MEPCHHFVRWCEEYLTVTEGTLAGKHVKVHPFQRRIVHDLMCKPRPTQAIVSIPRGNGKTSLMAMLALWHACTVNGARAIVVAVNEQQALIGYRQAREMAEAHPVLSEQMVPYNQNRMERIRFLHTASEVGALPSSVRGLQGLRPSLALVDEVGFVDDRVWSTMALGLGKHKGSAIVGFGTPGFDRGVMWRIREQALSADAPKGLLYHEIAAPPGSEKDPYDPRVIRSANPAIRAGFLDLDAILSNAQTETRADYLTFRLGLWADRESAWVTSEEWGLLAKEEDLPPAGLPVALGFDGSVGGPKQHDTTALVAAYGSNVWVVGFWAPPPGAKTWRVPRDEVVAAIDTYLGRWSGPLWADPWHWRSELEDIERHHPGRVIEQNTGSKSRFGPMADRFRAAVQTGRLVHDGNEHLRDHVLGAVALQTPSGAIITKDMRLGERQNIDLATAAVLAHNAASQRRSVPAVW